MKLYIAEKPSLGRAIADALPKPHKKQDGYIEVGDGNIVSWCIGHLLEQAEPDDYDPKYKKWQFDTLPIVPDNWQFKAKTKTKKQLSVLKKLIKRADCIIHAGDPDREGQLLVDEVLEYVGLNPSQKQKTERLLISDLNLQAVKKALKSTKSNHEFVPLSVSALARARADWLYGMNLTRAFTLAGQKSGYSGVLSVGRVQTPVLGLVVRRDLEISQFVSKPFYEVDIDLLTKNNEHFTAKWLPSDACAPYMDEDKRVLSKALAENVIQRVSGQSGEVISIEKKPKKVFSPLPYNLSSLQIDANKAYGVSAKEVLDVCQSLYEKHKLITYPRSDNRYIPEEHFKERKAVLEAIKSNHGLTQEQIQNADVSLRSKCWNDKKVEAHHAIIPTSKQLKTASLGDKERKIYGLISRQYTAQFYPPFCFDETKAMLQVAGGKFVAKAKTINHIGFKALFGKSTENKEEQSTCLPHLEVKQLLHCNEAILIEKQTQAPQHYTDATLLSAMTGISRYVQDNNVKKILKETDGLGTEATRAGIIELILKRGYVSRTGKQIKATEVGMAMVDMLPEHLTLPDRTAIWEANLAKIANKEHSYKNFMVPLLEQLRELIGESKSAQTPRLSGLNITVKKKYKSKRPYRKKNTQKLKA